MRNQRSWLPTFVFLFPAILLPLVGALPICSNDIGNYTADSTYQINLSTLLSSLPTNVDIFGFANASVGQNPDRANAIVLCRGDIPLDTCLSCIQNATNDLLYACPNQRQATMWLDLCMLRYSNESIFGTVGNRPPGYEVNSTEDSTSPTQFMANLTTLLDDLRTRAASGGSLWKMAAGNITAPDFRRIFGMVMCTPDLTMEDCNNCLMSAAMVLPRCCDAAIGAKVFRPSCFIQYEITPFFNATRFQEITALSLPSPAPPPAPPGPDDNTTRTIIIVVAAVVASLILVVFVGFLIRMRTRQKSDEEFQNDEDEISVVESLQYEFGKIRAATNDFSEANKLGQGGFGVVYKGKLLNDQEIAVKRLSKNSGQGNLEFKNEVMLLARLQHRNLVRLKGFSLEGTEKLLVYEFVENASLDNFIFDPDKRSYLDWDRCYKIISGIARGLLYLHEDSRLRIIHRDLKASNVLLDGEMNPKIADFGMARLFVPDETQGNTSRIVGTYGYMAPEYAFHGQFSVKSDVFSFGVLVLEIISGQRNNNFGNGENIENLISSAWRNWHNGTAANLIDPALRGTFSGNSHNILKCIHIGLLCVQENAADRPTMASVVVMLNSFSITLSIPSKPAFFMPGGSEPDVSPLQEFNSSEADSEKSRKIGAYNSEHASRNDVSNTELYPR